MYMYICITTLYRVIPHPRGVCAQGICPSVLTLKISGNLTCVT